MNPAAERLDLSRFVCSTIALACNRDPASVSAETELLSLGMDSLTFVSVLTQVEAVYDIELGADEMLALFEAADVSELVARLAARMIAT